MSEAETFAPTLRARIRRRLLRTFSAFAVAAAPALGVATTANAQSSYGGSSYGTETDSADDGIRAPNTGFELVAQAATEQPVPFWGGVCALGVAAVARGLVVRRRMKRKQEN